MRALSTIIALVLVLTGPSLAGSADRDMPGVGTFIYCGSPIMTPVPSGMRLEFGLARSPGNMKVSFQAARSIG